MAARITNFTGKCPSAWILGLLLLVGPISMPAAREVQARPNVNIVPIRPTLCDEMKLHHVLGPEAPVGCERLSLVKFDYLDFNGRLHDDGEVVVMDAVAKHVLHIFTTLRDMRFPLANAGLMNQYEGNDDASMTDNNTSAFDTREIAGGGPISLHAYGLAIDVNPIQNPFAKRLGASLTFSPPAGVDYANRLNDRPGKLFRPGMAEAVIDVFANDGFLIWGGYWDDPIDYQHFEVSSDLAKLLARLSPPQAKAVFDRYVERYRACRGTGVHGAASQRSKCIMAAKPTVAAR